MALNFFLLSFCVHFRDFSHSLLRKGYKRQRKETKKCIHVTLHTKNEFNLCFSRWTYTVFRTFNMWDEGPAEQKTYLYYTRRKYPKSYFLRTWKIENTYKRLGVKQQKASCTSASNTIRNEVKDSFINFHDL